jgi:quercetin dioxygenase-like cupin family protein
MREIRTYAFEPGEPAAGWRVRRPERLVVTAGEVWLTIEGRPDDHWLAAGQSFDLPTRARVWVGVGKAGARVQLESVVPVSARLRPLRGGWRGRPALQVAASTPI